MTFKFETLPIENKDVLRQSVIDLFDRDITTVSCSFSSRNYAFIFSTGCFPSIIRVSIETPYRQVEDVLSELMWVDDLKTDIPNICQPIASLCNRLVERIPVGDKVYLVTMFRKANGSVLPEAKWDKQFFYNAGVLLGKIHRTSAEGYARGFRYKRKQWYEKPHYSDFSNYDEYFAPSARKDAEAVFEKVKKIPRDPRWYGMIHGDYQVNNMFCDWGDLWVFDFDDCCYGYFMFDIISFVHICIIDNLYASLNPNTTSRDRLLAEDNGILSRFRAGYTSEYQLPDEQWDLFDDFFRLFVAMITNHQITLKIWPLDTFLALNEPYLAYLKLDKSPIDRMDEVQNESIKRLTPEHITILLQLNA